MGDEHIKLRAQKDLMFKALNNGQRDILASQTENVGKDVTQSVGGNHHGRTDAAGYLLGRRYGIAARSGLTSSRQDVIDLRLKLVNPLECAASALPSRPPVALEHYPIKRDYRHCEERSDEAIHVGEGLSPTTMDCFAPLAMTAPVDPLCLDRALTLPLRRHQPALAVGRQHRAGLVTLELVPELAGHRFVLLVERLAIIGELA